MIVVGLIVGHNQAKAVCGDQVALVPSVAALAPQATYSDGLADGPTLVRLNGAGTYLVGHDALRYAPKRLISILDRSRYADPSFVAIARAALSAVLPECVYQGGAPPIHIRTGMPDAWFRDPSAQAALTTALEQAAAPFGQVTIQTAPEAAGVFYAWALAGGVPRPERLQGAVGTIDVGYRDANVALHEGGRYVAGVSVPGGMHTALDDIKTLLMRAYGLEVSLHDVDQAVRAGHVVVAGARCPLPDGTEDALAQVLTPVLAQARSLWPSGGRGLHALVNGGGGAMALTVALRSIFPQLVVPGADLAGTLDAQTIRQRVAAAQPHLAGAYGFAWAAQVQQRMQRAAA